MRRDYIKKEVNKGKWVLVLEVHISVLEQMVLNLICGAKLHQLAWLVVLPP